MDRLAARIESHVGPIDPDDDDAVIAGLATCGVDAGGMTAPEPAADIEVREAPIQVDSTRTDAEAPSAGL